MTAILIAVAYFVILSVIVGVYTKKRVHSAADFAKSSQGLGWVLVVFAFTLVPLGAGHTLSLWESAPTLGASIMWWGIITGGIFLPMMMLWFGPWARQTGLTTIPEILERMFGRPFGRMWAGLNLAQFTGIGAAETLATATAIYGLGSAKLPFVTCIAIALVLIFIYVYFGGMLQAAILNVVNAIVMIGGSYLGLFMLGHYLLSKVNGWQGVYDWYQSQGQVDMLQSFSIGNSTMWFNIIIPVTVLHCAACAVSQNMNGPFFAAKSEEDCRKGMFVGVFFNCLASVPWIIMALIAAIPSVTAIIGLTGNPDAAKLAPIALAVDALPAPIVGLLMVSLLCATLSTGGATVMANANLMANDIFKTSSNPKLNDKQKMSYVKIFVIVSTLLFALPAFLNAVIFPLFLWCFSFGIPVFAVYFLGLKVKISKKAAWTTVIIAYIVNCWWTFLPIPEWAVGPLSLNMYPVTIVTIVVALITTAIFPGEPGLLKQSSMAELGAKDA